MSEIESKVKAIIVDKLGVDEAEVKPEASFTNDLGADSLDTVELIMEFEKEFGISIPDDKAEKIGTVGDAIAYIEEKLMELKRVVVTGLGAVTPVGNTPDEMWNNLINGVSGAAPITLFDASKFKTQFACEVKNLNINDFIDRKEARKMDRYTQLAMIAAKQAVEDSKMDLDTEDKKMIADIAAGQISIQYGFHGPNYITASACASSSNALADAFNLIRLGKANAIVAGGAEAAICATGVGGFNAMHALSTRNDEPEKASRPFSASRDGFIMAEGSGCLILEELEHAKARGAKIYAEMVGAGMSADAHHITASHPEGLGAKLVMQNALEDAGMKPEDIDYINVHGTSTHVGDISEAKAIKEVFGDAAFKLNISSTKSMTGHLLGAVPLRLWLQYSL